MKNIVDNPLEYAEDSAKMYKNLYVATFATNQMLFAAVLELMGRCHMCRALRVVTEDPNFLCAQCSQIKTVITKAVNSTHSASEGILEVLLKHGRLQGSA